MAEEIGNGFKCIENVGGGKGNEGGGDGRGGGAKIMGKRVDKIEKEGEEEE